MKIINMKDLIQFNIISSFCLHHIRPNFSDIFYLEILSSYHAFIIFDEFWQLINKNTWITFMPFFLLKCQGSQDINKAKNKHFLVLSGLFGQKYKKNEKFMRTLFLFVPSLEYV